MQLHLYPQNLLRGNRQALQQPEGAPLQRHRGRCDKVHGGYGAHHPAHQHGQALRRVSSGKGAQVCGLPQRCCAQHRQQQTAQCTVEQPHGASAQMQQFPPQQCPARGLLFLRFCAVFRFGSARFKGQKPQIGLCQHLTAQRHTGRSQRQKQQQCRDVAQCRQTQQTQRCSSTTGCCARLYGIHRKSLHRVAHPLEHCIVDCQKQQRTHHGDKAFVPGAAVEQRYCPAQQNDQHHGNSRQRQCYRQRRQQGFAGAGCRQRIADHRGHPRQQQINQPGQVHPAAAHRKNSARWDGQRQQLLVIPAAEQMPIAGKSAGQHTDCQRRKLHQHKIEPVQPLRHQRHCQRQRHRAKAEHDQQHQHCKQQRVAKRSRPGAPPAGLAAAHKGRAQFQKLFFEQCTDHSASPVSSSSRKTSSSVSSPRTSSIAPSRTS